jgi:predicted TIM-barrel fold metal-dependent hydrolase
MRSSRVTRRHFLETAGSATAGLLYGAAVSNLLAEAGPGETLLDLHQHSFYTGRTHEQLLAHQRQNQVTTTVLLPIEGWMMQGGAKFATDWILVVGGNRDSAQVEKENPGQFLRFASSDPTQSRALDVIRGNLQRGAIGIGEMKYPVAVDSPEMHRVYKLAEEMRVPVLLHFEFETYNTGLERFDKVLKAYPKINFIGHAQTWWGNISASLDPLELYPKGAVKKGGLTDRLLSDYPNIYGDLSAGSGLNALTRDPEFSRDFLQRHQRKLIWGSDCNCLDGKGAGIPGGKCIAAGSLAALRELITDPAVLRRILYENGTKLLGQRASPRG